MTNICVLQIRMRWLWFLYCDSLSTIFRSFNHISSFHLQGDKYYPQCHPDLHGSEILENGALHKYILDLASMLDVRSLFLEVGEADWYRVYDSSSVFIYLLSLCHMYSDSIMPMMGSHLANINICTGLDWPISALNTFVLILQF